MVLDGAIPTTPVHGHARDFLSGEGLRYVP